MLFEPVVESCKGSAPKAHAPAFRLEPAEQGWKIFDGEKAALHVTTTMADIWSFSPFEPDEMANKTRTSRVIDVHTVHNTFVNLGFQGWPASAGGQSWMNWDWRKSSGSELEALASLEGPDGEWGHWLFNVRYDETWGRYRYTWDVEVRTVGREGMELFNMMLAGALANVPGGRRLGPRLP